MGDCPEGRCGCTPDDEPCAEFCSCWAERDHPESRHHNTPFGVSPSPFTTGGYIQPYKRHHCDRTPCDHVQLRLSEGYVYPASLAERWSTAILDRLNRGARSDGGDHDGR